MSEVVKVHGCIGSEGFINHIAIIKEKILCITKDSVCGATIYLEGGVCVRTKETYDRLLELITEER